MRTTVLDGYRLWSESYDSGLNPILSVESRLVTPTLGDLRGKRFLDAGCGTGRWLAEARFRGAIAVGADLCHEMLLEAAAKPGLGGALVEADIERLPIPSAWAHFVVCSFTLGYLNSAEDGIRELARVVSPGGVLVMTDVHPEGLRKGWTRSFRHGGEVCEIEHHLYEIADLEHAGARAGLELQRIAQGCFEETERELFQRAGKESLFMEAQATPAVLSVAWRKPR